MTTNPAPLGGHTPESLAALEAKAAAWDAIQEPLASLVYDVGQLPFRVKRDEACGNALFNSFETVCRVAGEHGVRLT